MVAAGVHPKVVATGKPFFTGGFSKAPYDIIGDTLRGTRGIMLDKFRQPEKLLEAMERLVPCLLYTSPSPRDRQKSRMPSSA